MKLCIDCKWFSASNFCAAPANGVSPLDGKYKIRFATSERISETTGDCSIKGLHWVKKEKIAKNPWYKFWR